MTPSSGRSNATAGAERRLVLFCGARFFGVPHEQDDGTDASGKQVAFHLVDAAQLLRDLHIAHHDGEWLIASAFSAAQFANGLFRIGAAGKMKAA